jgi:PAS domain S-box-containing protein
LPTDRVTWSEGIEDLFGFPPGSFNQSISSYLNCVHPADRDWVKQNLAEARESECSFEVEHRVRWPDGGTRWIYLKGNSAADDTGHVLRLSGVVMDITERKRNEVEIQKMAAFARYNPNPVLEFSAQGKLTYFNDAAQEMAVTLGRKHPAEILPPQVAQLVGECLATEEKRTFTGATPGGRTVSWSFFPILPHQVVHCYARDITERISLEEQLRQAQKMEAIGQLAGGVAHDFNNILTIIQGHVSLLATDPEIPTDARDNLDEVLGAAERAANLTRQLLTFSRKQVIQLQHLDINDVINRLARMLRRVIGEDVTLHFEQSPEPLAVHADAGMIEQVIMNLAVNARDAMPGGGTLTITSAAASITEVHLAFHPEARAGDFVRLSVSDTGTGISPENLPHIFEPFFTTKEIGKGTGLGLASVYGIVKQHQGWIEVDSQEGVGTTFRIFSRACRNAPPRRTPRARRRSVAQACTQVPRRCSSSRTSRCSASWSAASSNATATASSRPARARPPCPSGRNTHKKSISSSPTW